MLLCVERARKGSKDRALIFWAGKLVGWLWQQLAATENLYDKSSGLHQTKHQKESKGWLWQDLI